MSVDLASLLQACKSFEHLVDRSGFHRSLRTGQGAGGFVAVGKARGTVITLIHDASARKRRGNRQVKADTGLSLRNVPRTDVSAFCAAEAEGFVDGNGPFRGFIDSTEGAEFSAGGVKTLHAASRQVDGATVRFECLDV